MIGAAILLQPESPGCELLEAALAYAAQGWAVFPCRPRDKRPCKKDGFFEHGVKEATKDPARIRALWAEWPHANIGVATGTASGFWVLDTDVDQAKRKDGYATLNRLEAEHGKLPDTRRQHTPSGGHHRLFALPDFSVRNSVEKRLGSGLDSRGDGGYIVVPPSIHPNGRRYRWIVEDAAIVPAPAWLLDKLRDPPAGTARPANAVRGDWQVGPYARAALDAEVALVRAAQPGTRSDQLNTSAFALGQLVGGGALPRGMVEQHLTAAVHSWVGGSARVDLKKSYKTIQGGIDAGTAQPRRIPDPSPRSDPARGGAGARSPQASARPPDVVAGELLGARQIWRAAGPIQGTPAERWLVSLGVSPAELGDGLRALRAAILDYPWADPSARPGTPPRLLGRWSCLVAAMAPEPGRLTAVHLVFLDQLGRPATVMVPETGEILSPRLTIGAPAGAAVRLAPPGPRLVLATTLELALVVATERPAWAAINLGNLGRVRVDPSVGELTLGVIRRRRSEHAEQQLRDAATAHARVGLKVKLAQLPEPRAGRA